MAGVCGIIPARLESVRLPRKMLLTETGQPLVQHTWEAARPSSALDALFVATDSEEIAAAVRGFGGEVIMTGHCESGTDRLADAVRRAGLNHDWIVNVQGDEPEMTPGHIDRAVAAMQQRSDCEMSTVACPIVDPAQVTNPACVKVVCAADGRALYFSRSPIPHPRDQSPADAISSHGSVVDSPWLLHMGLYVYRREFLLAFAQLPPSRLETTEKLEQLRALQAGAQIAVAIVREPSVGIDTPADYAAFVARWNRRSSG